MEDLRKIYIEKQILDVHYQLQLFLRQWVRIHIVSAAAMIFFIAYHLAVVIYY